MLVVREPQRKKISEHRRAQNRAAQRTYRSKQRSLLENAQTYGASSEMDILSDGAAMPSLPSGNPTTEDLMPPFQVHGLHDSSQIATASLSDGDDWMNPMRSPHFRELWSAFDLDSESQKVPMNALSVDSESSIDTSGIHQTQTFSRKTALHLAAENGHDNSVRMLLQTTAADINALDVDGNTALHLSAKQGHLLVVRALVQCGIELEARNSTGYTALHCAIEENFWPIAQLLIDHGMDANARVGFGTSHGDSPLPDDRR